MAGSIDVMFDPMPPSIAHIRSGKLVALASSPMGAEALPDVPATADLVSGYETGSWFGIGAPKATASSVIRQLKTPLLSRPVFLLGACHALDYCV
jgi:tripartite-type tricarboxylate transporter receptor subunit TctC